MAVKASVDSSHTCAWGIGPNRSGVVGQLVVRALNVPASREDARP
jgi:hypothetical protein